MFRFFRMDKQKAIDDAVKGLSEGLEGLQLTRALEENIAVLKRLFTDVDILRLRRIENKHDSCLKYCIAYCEGVVNAVVINENIIKPLINSGTAQPGKGLLDELAGNVLQADDVQKTESFASIIDAVSYGQTVLFADGTKQALILETKRFTERAITEPESERIITGPREGFTEALMTNLSLIRRKVRTHELKMKFMTMGRRTQTKICVCYMDSTVNKNILKELFRRLDTIDIDSVLDTNYLMELIRDNRLSPFRTLGYTERPDALIGKLLEGRIGIIVDGTPSVLTLPYLFIENFQSSEDYYASFYYNSFSRGLRIFGFFLAVIVPGAYVAISGFHHEMFPTQLLLNIAAERMNVPLPAFFEAFVMLIVFDLLREMGVRMPTAVGQPLSFVGALVIGTAAVEARLVAAAMVIIIAVTGLTSLLVPKLGAATVFCRYGLLLIASMFGLFGLMAGVSIIIIHIVNLSSFGVPQVSFSGNLKSQEIKDTFIRAPWWHMKQRPKDAANKTRMKAGKGQ